MAELLFFQRWQNFYTPRDGGIIILPEMAELLFSQRWRDYYSPRDGGIIILPEMAELLFSQRWLKTVSFYWSELIFLFFAYCEISTISLGVTHYLQVMVQGLVSFA